MPDTFDTIILIARPAAGKSEIINYLKHSSSEERLARFHIGEFLEVDDFPMLWTWFEEDALLEQMGKPRLHTTPDGYFLYQHLWDLLIRRLCLEHQKIRRDHASETIIMEFSRGSEHGGYRSAFVHLTPEVLANAAILYLQVPWEESLRKNRARFNPERPDSILEHGLPDAKLEKLYRHVDWEEITSQPKGTLTIQGIAVPFVVFDNEDDVTTAQGAALGERLAQVLDDLWGLYQAK
jgi:hypothetical protein